MPTTSTVPSQPRSNTFIIGLTGGIGSGKTTVTNLFAKLGIDIVDADVISRALLKKGSTTLTTVIQHFGNDYINTTGELNRSLLGKTIFADAKAKLWLENLLHPLIRAQISTSINQSTSPYVIISAPLLLESEQYNFVDRVLVVDLPVKLQISRTVARDHTTLAEVEKIILAQMDRQQRLSKADDIILNTSNYDELTLRVKELHEYYREQSQHKHQTG